MVEVFNFLKKLWHRTSRVFYYKPAPGVVIVKGIPQRDRRLYNRIKFNVKIAIKNFTKNVSLNAKSVDLSFNGIGVKLPLSLSRLLSSNDILEMRIYFPDKLEPLYRLGKVVWFKKGYFYHRGGIQFQEESSLISHK